MASGGEIFCDSRKFVARCWSIVFFKSLTKLVTRVSDVNSKAVHTMDFIHHTRLESAGGRIFGRHKLFPQSAMRCLDRQSIFTTSCRISSDENMCYMSKIQGTWNLFKIMQTFSTSTLHLNISWILIDLIAGHTYQQLYWQSTFVSTHSNLS